MNTQKTKQSPFTKQTFEDGRVDWSQAKTPAERRHLIREVNRSLRKRKERD